MEIPIRIGIIKRCRSTTLDMTSLFLFQERKAVQEEMEKMEAKHRQHDKLKHPMTKDQLEEVWEEQDHMEAKVGSLYHILFIAAHSGFSSGSVVMKVMT
jgi:hypothetical protein